MSGQIIPVLMCGGVGTRLWPLSRSADPKQFQPLASPESMLVETIRAVRGAAVRRSADARQRRPSRPHPRRTSGRPAAASYQMLIEPVVRSTGPAIAAAAVALAAEGRNALMLVSPSDHIVGNPQGTAGGASPSPRRAAAAGAIALVRHHPRQAGDRLWLHPRQGRQRRGPRRRRLHRKAKGRRGPPSCWHPATATGTAACSCSASPPSSRNCSATRLELLRAAEAAVAKGRRDGRRCGSTRLALPPREPLSIDYAVMEKSSRCKVVPVSPQWSDVGSWEALWEVGHKDADGNVAQGRRDGASSSNDVLVQSAGGRAGGGARDATTPSWSILLMRCW